MASKRACLSIMVFPPFTCYYALYLSISLIYLEEVSTSQTNLGRASIRLHRQGS